MNQDLIFIEITNTETGRHLFAGQDSTGDYLLTLSLPFTVERVRKRSIGKRIREFMKEKNGKQEKTCYL